MPENKSILIVEDDPDIADLIQLHLKDHYEQVEIARDGIQGHQMATKQLWSLIILDLRLPGKDGLELCRELRANEQYMPILMLTSKSSTLDRVLGLDLGADDYLTKPFSLIELVARIKAIFRRVGHANTQNEPSSSTLESTTHDIHLYTQTHRVTKGEQAIELTTKEFDLLHYFLEHPDRVFSRAHLLDKIWGAGHDGYEHTVNSHINRLRSKIEDRPTDPQIITTVWGVGYKLSEQP